MALLALLVMFAMQQPAATPPVKPPPTVTPPPVRRTAAVPATLDVRVTDRSGTSLDGATVSLIGPSYLHGTTDDNGSIVFKGVSGGTYRVRVERDGFITMEKELTVRTGVPAKTQVALSAAPNLPPDPPPPPPPPVVEAPPPPAPPTGVRGEPRLLSTTALAERSLGGRDSVKVVSVGCTGLTNARLIVLRDALPTGGYSDADENLYLIAGEATISIDAKPQAIAPGWFAMLPRDTKFEIVRKGRNPAIFLSLLNGRPCGQPTGELER